MSLPLLLLPLAALGAFLLGSIPFGVLYTRLYGLGDVRQVGSGNIGATNVLRMGHRGVALLTLLADIMKGIAGGWLMLRAGLIQPAPIGAALLVAAGSGLAVIGHCYSPWLGGRGGKGVSSALGGLLAIGPTIGGATIAVWLALAVLRRKSSLAALVSIGASPLVIAAGTGDWWAALAWLPVMLVVVRRHRDNIRRLLAGTEPDIALGGKSKGTGG